MSDLVKRLRSAARWLNQQSREANGGETSYDEAPFEAADEIEGLRGLLCAARDELEFWTPIEAGATPSEIKSLASYYKLRDQIDATIRDSSDL